MRRTLRVLLWPGALILIILVTLAANAALLVVSIAGPGAAR